jgi:hypothetical protein
LWRLLGRRYENYWPADELGTCPPPGSPQPTDRIQLFEKKKRKWSHIGSIKLPRSVLFTDYSGMAVDGYRAAIVSQENSMLWTGVFEEAKWSWRDDGQTFQFPRTTSGEISYGNVEGVAWLKPIPNRVVTVSDRRKDDQPEHLAKTDQSIHIFDLPS